MVEHSVRDGTHVLRLARPPVNALNLELASALAREVAAAGSDPGCRALVLVGAPGVFSAGIDTKQIPAYAAEDRAAMLRTINRTVLALYGFSRPAVAAISGHALGGALVLALTCDVRLAARGDHKLGLTEAAAGIPFPAGPLAVVEAELPPDSRRRLCLEAAAFAPEDPALASVVDEVVEPGRLLDAALDRAAALAALPGQRAVKQQLRAATVARLRRIVDEDDEPLLAGWL